MRKLIFLFAIFFVSLPGIPLPAASVLPKLKDDPDIVKGVLPNGVSYFLASNPSVSGVADIAILQRTCQTPVDVPTTFLARKGIFPGREGYVTRKQDNIVYNFRDCPFAGGDGLVDSLLVAVFDIIGRASVLGDPPCGTVNQTIIIAGDIDRAAVLTKLRLLSHAVPFRAGVAPAYEYSWSGGGGRNFRTEPSDEGPVTVTFSYRMPASPREEGGTTVDVMSELLSGIYGTILTAAVRKHLRKAGIVEHGLDFSMMRSDAHDGDDTFTLTLSVDRGNLEQALAVPSAVFAEMRSDITEDRYLWAYNKVVADEWAASHEPRTNASYVQQCMNSILYGASLATLRTKVDSYRTRDLPDSVRLRLFNRFARAMVGGDGDFDITVSGAVPGLSAAALDSLLHVSGPRMRLVTVDLADTLSLPGPQPKKASPPSVRADALTGGSLMTFKNGISLLYKKMPTDGIFYYSWILRGGEKDGISIADSYSGSMSGEAFLNLLAAVGITMEVKSTSTDIRVEGRAEKSRLKTLMKFLQALFEGMPELGSPAGGQLVIVGDISEQALIKALLPYAGGFENGHPPRARNVVEGGRAPEEGDTSIIYQGIWSGDCLLSAENFLTAAMADIVVSKALGMALDGTGYCCRVDEEFTITPRDMLSLHIKVMKVEGMEQTLSAYRVKSLVRSTLADLARNACPQGELDIARAIVCGGIEKRQKTPQYWLEAARMRWSDSKDIVTRYKEKAGQVTPEKLRSLLKSITENGPAEMMAGQ